MNPHNYKFLINEPDYCQRDEVDLLILVTSALEHRKQRDGIRASWASKRHLSNKRVKVLFLLGNGRDQVYEESRKFGDIIQEDFHDSYRNLTLKTMMGLKWASAFCPQARNILKTDDDIFVNIDDLLPSLSKFDRGRITGCIKNGPAGSFMPIPDPNNPAHAALPPAHPAFAAGAGYVLPGGEFAFELYKAALNTRPFPVEDVFTTAHAARRIAAHPPAHDRRFSCGEMAHEDDCRLLSSESFTAHKVKPDRMEKILQKSGKCRLKKSAGL